MKSTLTVILLFIACQWADAQTWQPLTATITSQPFDGQSMYGRIAIDSQGTPYVTLFNYKTQVQPPVTRFNGHSWEPVGETKFYPDLIDSQIAIHPDGTPYIVYDSDTVAAWKFNGIDWEPLGSTHDRFYQKDIAIDSAGTPYISYSQLVGDDYKIVVVKLNVDQWETVGEPGFGIVKGRHQIAIAPDGMPWVAAQGGGVWRFDGSAWQRAGTLESLTEVNYPRLAFAPDGTTYIADREVDVKNVKVMKLTDNQWEMVGDKSFPLGFGTPEIAVDASGILYLAFSDALNGDKATVMRFKDGSWENVGNAAFSDTRIEEVSLAIDPEGIPYIVYTDKYEGFDDYVYKLRVKRLIDNKWEALGGTGITKGHSGIHSAATDSNGWIYLLYGYASNLDFFDNWHRAAVVRYNGSIWEDLGDNHNWNGIENEQIAAGSDGIPYVAYSDSANDLKITVERFINNQWEIVGNEAFTESNAVASIAVGTDNMPYVAYTESAQWDASVKRFNGTEWEHVGTPVLADSTSSIVIFMDKEGTPYVAYIDMANLFTQTVKKFNGNEWEMVGNGDTLARNYESFLTIDPSGTPYVLYGNMSLKIPATIKKFNGTNWEALNSEGWPSNLLADHLVFDTEGHAYVIYKDIDNGNNASVIKYNGNSWEPFGNSNFTQMMPTQQHLLIDNNDNFYAILSSGGLWDYKYMEDCMNPTAGGTIAGSQSDCSAFDPESITSSSLPIGQAGTLEYLWQRSTISSTSGFTDIFHDAATYDPPLISRNTWFRRLARTSCMTDWMGAAFSDVVQMIINLPPEIHCPANDTVFNDTGSMFARKSYSALPEGTPDTMAIYLVDGHPITFPYDFPAGITQVEVKANCSNAVVACSFTVTVKQFTGTEDLDVNKLSVDIYPNPFTNQMAIEITNPLHISVSAEIYNLSGQKIKSLVRAHKGAKISLAWDGSNGQGQKVTEGVYILKVNEGVWKVVKRQ